jgi:cytochrome c oxidase subunit IV
MASHSHDHDLAPGEIAPAQTGQIWKTFWVLVGITAIEFVFVFFMAAGTMRNAIFIVLTIFKAFFIVGEFMHLKHEVKGLIWSILIPMALVVWLVVALVTEGSFLNAAVR